MTEETAIRIAEALEGIENGAAAFIALFIGFAVFWIIAIFKH